MKVEINEEHNCVIYLDKDMNILKELEKFFSNYNTELEEVIMLETNEEIYRLIIFL